MAKIFDYEDEPNEYMEAPCRCDCGMWFDLDDGYRSSNGNKVICPECHEAEVAEENMQEEDENQVCDQCGYVQYGNTECEVCNSPNLRPYNP